MSTQEAVNAANEVRNAAVEVALEAKKTLQDAEADLLAVAREGVEEDLISAAEAYGEALYAREQAEEAVREAIDALTQVYTEWCEQRASAYTGGS